MERRGISGALKDLAQDLADGRVSDTLASNGHEHGMVGLRQSAGLDVLLQSSAVRANEGPVVERLQFPRKLRPPTR
ncbi:MAG: hypothetical protein ACJAYU_000888 [Bradymonadia bacterium]|jgi:hypothetical protein